MSSYKRSEYSYEEKDTIVQEIIKRKAYNALRGNAFWQKFAARKILQRTWQSLKEHFRKKIIDIIHTFDISNEHKRLIKEGWESSRSSRAVKQDRNDKKIKRPQNISFSDEEEMDKEKEQSKKDTAVDDESDSSSTSCYITNINKKRIFNSKNKNVKRRKSPSEFNVFSDEGDSPIRKNIINDESSQYDSPDLLKSRGDGPLHVNKICKYFQPSCSELVSEPSCSGLHLQKKNESVESIVIDSDSDDTTFVNLDAKNILGQINSTSNTKDTTKSIIKEASCSSNKVEEISLEEDMLLINFFRIDKTNFKIREKIDIYNYFHEIYPHSKSPEQLKKRFLNHIFPNICEYNNLTHSEMINFYKDAGVDVPDNLNSLLKESYNTMNKDNIGKPIQKDFQMNISEHELNRKGINCIYCPIILKSQLHLFISDLNGQSDKERLFELVSKKFKTDREYIHYIDFASHFLLEQVNQFQNSIYEKYENIITQSLGDKYKNVNVKQVICDLEVCVKAFISNEDSSLENTDDSIIPQENSTPQNVNEENATLNQEIMEENMSSEQPFEVEIVSAVLNEYDPLEINDESYSGCIITGNRSKYINYSHENSEISSEDNNELQQICLTIKDENDSQYLESVSTQDSTNIRNAVIEMAKDEINDVNNSTEIPAISETFHTAIGFSQDL